MIHLKNMEGFFKKADISDVEKFLESYISNLRNFNRSEILELHKKCYVLNEDFRIMLIENDNAINILREIMKNNNVNVVGEFNRKLFENDKSRNEKDFFEDNNFFKKRNEELENEIQNLKLLYSIKKKDEFDKNREISYKENRKAIVKLFEIFLKGEIFNLLRLS